MRILKKILKWVGIGLGTLLGIVLVALAVIYGISVMRLNKSYTVPATTLTVPTDAATVAEGKRLMV